MPIQSAAILDASFALDRVRLQDGSLISMLGGVGIEPVPLPGEGSRQKLSRKRLHSAR
jgi:hypothetical protein